MFSSRRDRKSLSGVRMGPTVSALILFGAVSGLVWTPGTTASEEESFNYDESKVPSYTLPDPLLASSGSRITHLETWRRIRRVEILKLFQTQVYGRSPAKRKITTGEISVEHDALKGLATRKQVSIFFKEDKTGPSINLLIYYPNSKTDRVPAFLGLNFSGNHSIHRDPGIKLSDQWMRDSEEKGVVENRATEASRGVNASRWPVEKILSRGYALATAYYGDIDPDFDDGFKNGVHPLFYRGAQSKPAADEWGSLGAWAWGLSRALDYLERDSRIASRRVAVLGHSRLGKTALWAGAQDERFALVISNNSGCGGAALSRRRFGETVKRINTVFPHWFCRNFRKYNDNEDALPVDQHMLIALMAPRPVYVASAEEDRWADPGGEFLSAKHAGPVYRLLGKMGLKVGTMPPVNRPVMNTVGYHVRTGKHDVTDYDWDQYLEFAEIHLKGS